MLSRLLVGTQAADWDWGAISNGVLALVAVAGVLVALFAERLKQWLSQAKLRMTIDTRPPDTHQIAVTNAQTGQFLFNAVYVRIRVAHVSGNAAAENVELVVADVQQGGVRRDSFLPLPLVWSHWSPPRSNLRVPKGLFRHCDLGYFHPLDDCTTRFVFSTLVQPNPVAGGAVPNFLEPGLYEFAIVLTADNGETQQKRWSLTVPDRWSDDQTTMLARISIVETI